MKNSLGVCSQSKDSQSCVEDSWQSSRPGHLDPANLRNVSVFVSVGLL